MSSDKSAMDYHFAEVRVSLFDAHSCSVFCIVLSIRSLFFDSSCMYVLHVCECVSINMHALHV